MRFTRAIAANKQENSHHLKTYILIYFQLPSFSFTDRLSIGILWKLIIHGSELYYPKINECFWKKSCHDMQSLNSSLFAKQVALFFFLRSVHELFFMLSLIDRCQIVTDTCK